MQYYLGNQIVAPSIDIILIGWDNTHGTVVSQTDEIAELPYSRLIGACDDYE